MPFVSIITPCYNSAKYIGAAIESVRAQTFADWEMIVVDDGSTDNPASVVLPLSTLDPRVRLLQKANGGVASARNAGYASAAPDSKYLYFLDADDTLKPEMLQKMLAYLETHLEVGLVFTAPILIDEHGAEMGLATAESGWCARRAPHGHLGSRWLRDDEPNTPLASLFAVCTIIPSVSVIRRSVYIQTPGWDETFGHMYEDLDVFLQIALRSEIHWLPPKLVFYRRHTTQATNNAEREARQQAKLWGKWRAMMPGMTSEQRIVVAQAFRFQEDVLIPAMGWEAGKREMKHKHFKSASRYWGGAARRRLAALVRTAFSTFSKER